VATDVAALRRYTAVILDHVAADALTTQQTTALGGYVEQTGGGLLVLGDAHTLDAGGLAGGPLGRLLPVDFRPRAGARDPTMGLVLVFDKSGSMADRAEGIPKIEIAREAAKKAFDVVPPRDSIGVVAFDAAPTVAVPFGPAANARDLVERLRAIQPGGSTAIAPAVAMAVDWLRAANVTKRYVLLVSDGRTSPADADRLRATIRGTGVELSVVAIGTDADRPFLRSLAESSGGRAYFPDDARLLPTIVAREATRAAGGSTVDEPFTVRAGAHPILAGLDRSMLPAMGGYVVGAVRPGASALLSSHLDDPILAVWQIGLGRVAVFTSDLASPWTTAFRRWPSFGALWAQTARWIGRRTSDAMLTADVLESAGSATLVVNAERPDGRAVNLVDPRVSLRTATGEERAITLAPRAPGRYEAAIPATTTGTYVMAVSARDENGADARVVRAFYWSADRERRAAGADIAALARIAGATGGRVLGADDNPFDGERPPSLYPLRPLLLVVALVVFLVDIATRRGLRLTPRHQAAA
jgi:Mg-chelatase subunit ChlD